MRRKQTPKSETLTEQLRDAVISSGLSHYRIAKETGISQAIITRFANGTRGISLETANKLAEYFEMKLTPPNRKGE